MCATVPVPLGCLFCCHLNLLFFLPLNFAVDFVCVADVVYVLYIVNDNDF